MALVGALGVGGAFAFDAYTDRVVERQDAGEAGCCWRENVRPERAAREIGVRVPAGARDVRAGAKTGERTEHTLLTFTLPTDEARTFLAPLTSPGVRMRPVGRPQLVPDQYGHATFRRLGVTEPEELVGRARTTQSCPDGAPATAAPRPAIDALRACVRFYTYEYAPHRTRVYLRATSE